MTRPKIKVIQLPFFLDLVKSVDFFNDHEGMTQHEALKLHREWKKEEKNEYDGFLRYWKKCSKKKQQELDSVFPPCPGRMICIKLKTKKTFKGTWEGNRYKIYSKQAEVWWERTDDMFFDLYIPRMTEYEFDKLNENNPRGYKEVRKFLDWRYKKDWDFHRHTKERRNVYRESRIFMISCLKD